MTRYALTLPLPTLLNRLYRVGGGRVYKTQQAMTYRWAVKAAALDAGIEAPLRGPVAVTLRVYFARRGCDLDGVLKDGLDAMQGVLFENDRQIHALHLFKDYDRKNPRMDVEVTSDD